MREASEKLMSVLSGARHATVRRELESARAGRSEAHGRLHFSLEMGE